MALIGASPLILTLKLDSSSFHRLDALRRAHFPTARNLIPAHLTLFHRLPGDELDAVASAIAELVRGQPAVRLRATGLTFLGRGVAYAFDAPELGDLRARLAGRWSAWLGPQDRQGFRPHVTIQNKVSPADAQALLHRLAKDFEPFDARGEGMLLWRYLGGPWKALGDFAFHTAGMGMPP